MTAQLQHNVSARIYNRISFISISGFGLPSMERGVGIKDIDRMHKKFESMPKVKDFQELELM
jgi:hypothetical protein